MLCMLRKIQNFTHTWTGAGSSRLLSSGQSNWSHAHDWSGKLNPLISRKARTPLLIIEYWITTNCADVKGEKDDKIIAVCADDPEYRHYNDIKELPPHRLAEIRRFFEDCILPKMQILMFGFQIFYLLTYMYMIKSWNALVLFSAACEMNVIVVFLHKGFRQEEWKQGSSLISL